MKVKYKEIKFSFCGNVYSYYVKLYKHWWSLWWNIEIDGYMPARYDLMKGKSYDGNYKAYTELINRFEDVKDAIKKQNYGIAMDILCKPYSQFQVITHSELKESEGERIRKSLICHLKECRNNTRSEVMLGEYAKWIAWLEKQGEY